MVETDALAAGTAVVGDFFKAVLFDRKSLSITLGTINDQVIRNMVTVLDEVPVSAWFGQPAFVKATVA